MAWREHILAIIIPIVFWILLVWIGTTIWSYIRDAKKWRNHESRENKFWKSKWKLYEDIEKLEEEKEWSNAIIDDYIGYTWIYPREISEKLEKRNKRKKRK